MAGIKLQMTMQPSFPDILRDIAMATNFVAKLYTPLYLSHRHSKAKLNIETSMWTLPVSMMPLHRVKILQTLVQLLQS